MQFAILRGPRDEDLERLRDYGTARSSHKCAAVAVTVTVTVTVNTAGRRLGGRPKSGLENHLGERAYSFL